MDTFWTKCPICLAKSQYYRAFQDRKLICQRCNNPFEARELKNFHPNIPQKHIPQSQGDQRTFLTKCPSCCTLLSYYCCELDQLICCHVCQKTFKAHELEGVSSAGKKRNIAAVHKKEARGHDKNWQTKKRKIKEFEPKVKGSVVSPIANVDVVYTQVPSPQFHKFQVDADGLASLIEANQIWALYDQADGMPRFYVFVKEVLTPGFKLNIRWLDANPAEQGEIDWCKKKLPVACGEFRLGEDGEITDHLTVSHQVHCTEGSRRSSILVYPRRGETWAIYQSWDIGWSSEPKKHKPYKYEIVEVLSDFVEDKGINVSYLSKVKGFVSLFQRTEQHGFQVPPDEMYRFSHKIPSVQMTGDEGHVGVPSGSFELDTASLPPSILFSDADD